MWEKDASSRSHSSCRLPLPLQVQLKATLALTLLTKLGVMAVPVGCRGDCEGLGQPRPQLPPSPTCLRSIPYGFSSQSILTRRAGQPMGSLHVYPILTNQPRVCQQTSGLVCSTGLSAVHGMAVGLKICQARSGRRKISMVPIEGLDCRLHLGASLVDMTVFMPNPPLPLEPGPGLPPQ